MRNLKKILSLALALMMVLSVMVTASATTFKDDAKISADYKEAVEVLTGMKVINGVGDEFLPQDYLNREAAAKIVAYILEGSGLDAAIVDAINNPFSDVSGWSVDVIKYCYANGVVDGVGDGKFLPKDYLTGYAFAKMLLVAAGVDGEYTGGNWRLNIATNAKKAKFLVGLEDVALSGRLTREQACQMAFNAMYYTATAGSTGDWAYDQSTHTWIERPGVAADSLAYENFGLQKVTGVITANQATGAPATMVNKATFNTDGKISALGQDAVDYNVETGLDMVGHVVTVYYKTTGEKGVTYAVVDQSSVVTVAAAISSDATKMAAAFGKGTKAATAVYNFTNYSGVSGNAITGFTQDASAAAGTYMLYGGEIVSFVAPAANVGVVSKVTAYTAPTASATGSVTITGLKNDGTIGATAAITLEKIGSTTADKVKLYDGIAANDYVYVTKVGTSVTAVEKAMVITEAVTARASDNSKITVAGKEYSVIADVGNAGMITANNTTVAALDLTAVSDVITLGAIYNVVMTSDGKVLGYYEYTPASEANNYAVIQGISVVAAAGEDTWSGSDFKPATAQVKLALADGTSAVYSIKMTEAQTKESNQNTLQTALLGSLAEGDVVKYAASGSVITEIKTAGANESATELKKGSTLITSVTGKYLTTDTVFLYWDSNDVTNFTITRFVGYNAIKNTGPLSAGKISIVFNSANKAVFAYVDLAGTTSTSNTLKAYFPNDTYTARYDATLKQTVYDYTAYVDGVKTTLTAKSAIAPTGTAGTVKLATYTMTDGYLTAIAYLSAGSAADNYVDQQIAYVAEGILVANGVEYAYSNAKAFVVAADGTVTASSVIASTDAYNTVLVIKTAAAGDTVADLAYIYYYAV